MVVAIERGEASADANSISERTIEEEDFRIGGDAEAPRSMVRSVLSTSGVVARGAELMATCKVVDDGADPHGLNGVMVVIDAEARQLSVASALATFLFGLGRARGLPEEGAPSELAVAAASNDIGAVGRLLGERNANTVTFDAKELPESVVRHPRECSLLDVAVGSGSVEMTKYLLEFHRANPTRETLKMALSTGNLELIKRVRERLPEGELRGGLELLEVAADFHQLDVVAWLHREASVFERELLAVFALEHKLADMLVVQFENGFHPWWGETRVVSVKWRASAGMGFVAAPEGFCSDGGWWKSNRGVESAMSSLGSKAGGVWTLPGSVDRGTITYVALPPGVTIVGQSAFSVVGV
jgi:hypothetical protein